MATKQPHAAFARTIETLEVVVVDDSKSMQSILRSMLHGFKVSRVRTYDSAQSAISAMMVDTPHLVIVDWMMQPIDGITLIKAMRSKRMGALSKVPTIILTSAPTERLVESALRASVHSVLAKPISPATLQKRIMAILNDNRQFMLDKASQTWVLDGTSELLAVQEALKSKYRHARGAYVQIAKPKIAASVPIDWVPMHDLTIQPALPVKEKDAAQLRQQEAPRKKVLRKAVGISGRRIAPLPPSLADRH